MVGGDETDVGVLASMGIPPEQWEKYLTPDDLDIWPENWSAVEVFGGMLTQWRIGMAGPTGLDYAALPAVMELFGTEDRKAAFEGLMVMEREALNVFKDSSNGRQ